MESDRTPNALGSLSSCSGVELAAVARGLTPSLAPVT